MKKVLISRPGIDFREELINTLVRVLQRYFDYVDILCTQ